MARYGAATRLGSSSMSSTMQEIGAALARQAEMTSERLQSLASAFREALPTNGAAALVSEGLGSASSYFSERDFGDVTKDIVDLVRRHPVQAMLIGAGFGYLVSRFMRRTPAAASGGSRVKDVMTRHVEVTHPDASVKDAAAKMADLDVGVIPVCDGERLVGMLTDRDITIRAIARGADPQTPVREIMSMTVRYAFEDEPIDRARETMKRHKIRRLPVLDSNRRLTGIVSLGDLALDTNTEDARDVLERVSAAQPTH